MTAMFLMACRQKNAFKGMAVPQVSEYNSAEQDDFNLRFYLGQSNQINRKKNSEISLKNHIPSVDEIKLLHDILFVNDIEKKFENVLKTEDQKLEKVIYAHEQNKNVHGKLFGGNIMRECFEIAYMAAYMLGNGENPELYHIGDTQVDL